MTTREKVVLATCIGILIIGGILGIQYRNNPQETPQAEPEGTVATSSLEDEYEQDTVDDVPQQEFDNPIIVYTLKDTSSEDPEAGGELPEKQVPLYSWDILNNELPKETVTFEGRIIDVTLDENHILRLDTSEGTRPNSHHYYDLNGSEFSNPRYPDEGNFLSFFASPKGNATALVAILPFSTPLISVFHGEYITEISTDDLPSPLGESWNTISPFGFSSDGSRLFVLAEQKQQNVIQANGLYEFTLKDIDSPPKEILVQENLEREKTATVVKNNIESGEIILERLREDGKTLVAYNPEKQENTLLVPKELYRHTVIEHPDHISPDGKHIVLYHQKNEQYVVINTQTHESISWEQSLTPLSWIDNEHLIAIEDDTASILTLDGEVITERTIPTNHRDRMEIIGIIPPTK